MANIPLTNLKTMETENNENEALNKTDVMLRLQYKLNEYKLKKDIAKEICDKQQKFDISFEAEVEDEILLLAEKQFLLKRNCANIFSVPI